MPKWLIILGWIALVLGWPLRAIWNGACYLGVIMAYLIGDPLWCFERLESRFCSRSDIVFLC